MQKQKEFHTISLVVDVENFIEAEEIKCKVIKFLEAEGTYIFETKTQKGWKTEKR